MSDAPKKKKFFEKLKSIKHIEIIIAVAAVAIMLLLYFSTKAVESNKDNNTQGTYSNYCEKIEQELTLTLSAMKGVGKTKLIINWESGVASSSNSSQTPNSSKTDSKKEVYPSVVGVIIICQGGEDVKIKIQIINAVSVLLNVSPNKINVYPMA